MSPVDLDLDLMPPLADAPAPKTFTEAFDGVFTRCGWFGEPTWGVWRVVGKAIFGERMSAAERATFSQFTGRATPPPGQVREFWGIVGRRGGKGWFVAAVCVYLACFRPPRLKAGTQGRVLVLAADKSQAGEVFGYVRRLLALAGLEDTVEGETRETIDLSNDIQIAVFPADRRRVRGRTVVAAVCDEVASWWNDEQNANPDVEILRALRPGMLGVPGAMLLAISSPYSRKGSLWEANQAYGAADPRVLVWRATTLDMRPSTDPEFLQFLTEEKAKDPVSFSAEYGGQFRDDLETFVTSEVLDAVTVKGRLVLDPTPTQHVLFGDLASGMGQDSAAVCVARWQDGLAQMCYLAEWRPPFDAVDVAKQIGAVAKAYGISAITVDQYAYGVFKSIFREHVKGLAVLKSKSTTIENYRTIVPLLTGKSVALLDHQRLRNQFLSLERRVGTQSQDIVTHGKNGHDDLCSATAGALVKVASYGRPLTVDEQRKLVGSYVRQRTPLPSGRTVDARGTRYLGGDVFVTADGLPFRDPRGL